MAREVKEGEFSLVYNTKGTGLAVGLTEEQHTMLQLLLAGIGEIQVLGDIEVKYEEIKK